MNQARKNIVKTIYELLLPEETEEEGVISISELKNLYNPAKHPDVIRKTRTEQDVFKEFVETLDEFYNLILVCDRSVMNSNIGQRRKGWQYRTC